MRKDSVFQMRLDDNNFAKSKFVAEAKGISLAGLLRMLLLKEIEAYEKEYGEIVLPEKESEDKSN